MTRTFFSKIKLYISAYATIFALAAFCLLCFHERYADNPNLNDNSWKAGLHTNRTLMRDSDPLSLTYAGLRWTSNVFNCSVISEIENLELVGAGWTKAVYKGQWKDRTVAVKTLNFYGYDVVECSSKGFPLEFCYEKAAVKILREMALLTKLQHKNIIKVLGACVPGWEGTLMEEIAVVTEYGEIIDTIKLLQMNFGERLKLALDIAEILHHLAHSPLGSLALLDFRKQQFVLVNGILKLSDVDDVGVQNCNCKQGIRVKDESGLMFSRFTEKKSFEEEFIKPADDFRRVNGDPININFNKWIVPVSHDKNCQTVQGQQHERQNIEKAGKLFIDNVLIHGCPRHLTKNIQELALAYTNLNANWNTSKILQFTKSLYEDYITERIIK